MFRRVVNIFTTEAYRFWATSGKTQEPHLFRLCQRDRFLIFHIPIETSSLGHLLSKWNFTVKILFTGLLTGMVFANALSQTVITNWVMAAPSFREVNGKLYNVDRSTNWTSIHGEIEAFATNGAIVKTWDEKIIYQTFRYSDSLSGSGNFLGAGSGPSSYSVPIATNRVNQKNLFVADFPIDQTKSVIGERVDLRALRIGLTNCNLGMLELWEYGKPHIVAVVKTNEVSQAAK